MDLDMRLDQGESVLKISEFHKRDRAKYVKIKLSLNADA